MIGRRSLFEEVGPSGAEDEVVVLRRRVAELERQLAEERRRSLSLEARLAEYEPEECVSLARRRVAERREAEESFWSDDQPATRRRPRRAVEALHGRPPSFARQRLKASGTKANVDDAAPMVNDDLVARATSDVRDWAGRQADVVDMLASLSEILPRELITGLDSYPQGGDPKAVRRAYFQVARRCHPDKLAGSCAKPEARLRAQFVFTALTDALDYYLEHH